MGYLLLTCTDALHVACQYNASAYLRNRMIKSCEKCQHVKDLPMVQMNGYLSGVRIMDALGRCGYW